jgi:hypothetical protein
LGERLLCKQEVDGSIPFTSTSARRALGAVSDQLSAETMDREKQEFAVGLEARGRLIFDRVKRE